jgi:hypothetical protein
VAGGQLKAPASAAQSSQNPPPSKKIFLTDHWPLTTDHFFSYNLSRAQLSVTVKIFREVLKAIIL